MDVKSQALHVKWSGDSVSVTKLNLAGARATLSRRRPRARKEFDVPVYDPLPLGLVRLHRPDAPLRCASENDPVAPRHHVNADAGRRRQVHAT